MRLAVGLILAACLMVTSLVHRQTEFAAAQQQAVCIDEDFSEHQTGQPPSGWLLRGAPEVTPLVEEVGGAGPAYRLLSFPFVNFRFWDRWALKDASFLSAPYTVSVKLNFQNSVADRAGLTIAWDDSNRDRIDIQPNIFWDNIEFRVAYSGPDPSNIVVSGSAAGRGGLPIQAGVDYWLRVSAISGGPGQGQLDIYWSSDGLVFTQVLQVTGLANVNGLVGVGTAGPNLPHTHFDDFPRDSRGLLSYRLVHSRHRNDELLGFSRPSCGLCWTNRMAQKFPPI